MIKKIWAGSPKVKFLPFKLPIDKRILIEGNFRVMRITLSKIKRSLCTIDEGLDGG